MLDNPTAQVALLKELAKYYRDRADHIGKTKDLYQLSLQKLDRALSYLQEAIELLRSRCELAKEGSEDSIALRRELADCFGIQGGIYRRYAFLKESEKKLYLEKAAASYKIGLSYESNDSYNLFNQVVIQILLDPNPLENHYPEIQKIRDIIQEQVYGSRADQWWAWADLGLIDLLMGNEDEARRAYRIFSLSGTRTQDYDSALSVLRNLEEVLHTNVSQISQSVVLSMSAMIGLLETNKAV